MRDVRGRSSVSPGDLGGPGGRALKEHIWLASNIASTHHVNPSSSWHPLGNAKRGAGDMASVPCLVKIRVPLLVLLLVSTSCFTGIVLMVLDLGIGYSRFLTFRLFKVFFWCSDISFG